MERVSRLSQKPTHLYHKTCCKETSTLNLAIWWINHLVQTSAFFNLRQRKLQNLLTCVNISERSIRTLREKCPYSELFWSAFSRIRTRILSECGKMRTIITLNTNTFYAVEAAKILFYKLLYWVTRNVFPYEYGQKSIEGAIPARACNLWLTTSQRKEIWFLKEILELNFTTKSFYSVLFLPLKSSVFVRTCYEVTFLGVDFHMVFFKPV